VDIFCALIGLCLSLPRRREGRQVFSKGLLGVLRVACPALHSGVAVKNFWFGSGLSGLGMRQDIIGGLLTYRHFVDKLRQV
jgi:hypothetical protein